MWAEIIGVTIVIVVLLGLAGSFMARVDTSTNLAWLTGVGRLVRGSRRPTPPWIADGLRGELGDDGAQRGSAEHR